MSRFSSIVTRLGKAGSIAEDALLALILGGMILLAFGQIVLRNTFDIGFFWSDELLRLMVLWLTVAGAVAASRGDNHLSIAVLDRFLPPRALSGIKVILHLFTTSICVLISWHSLRFVQSSYEYGDIVLGGMPAWALQAVMPVGFAVIAWRYALQAIGAGLLAVRGGDSK
jgi:TRAP-type C4-dicarboxylate transport system permease small subunit